jgi:hypothetical protein
MKSVSIILALAVLLSASSWAEEDLYTIKTYASFTALKADTAKRCEFVSHDCEICTVSRNETFSCSSVGAACEPKEWRCYEKAPAPR